MKKMFYLAAVVAVMGFATACGNGDKENQKTDTIIEETAVVEENTLVAAPTDGTNTDATNGTTDATANTTGDANAQTDPTLADQAKAAGQQVVENAVQQGKAAVGQAIQQGQQKATDAVTNAINNATK